MQKTKQKQKQKKEYNLNNQHIFLEITGTQLKHKKKILFPNVSPHEQQKASIKVTAVHSINAQIIYLLLHSNLEMKITNKIHAFTDVRHK